MPSTIKKLKHPLFIVFVYLLVHFLIRISLSDTIQVDDREQIITAQFLQLGYNMPQPPLYSWISWVFFQVFDSTLLATTLVKYTLIFLTLFFLWKLLLELFHDQRIVVIAFYSFALMPSFFWHMHQGFTHTILLGFSIIGTVYSLILTKKDNSTKNYLLLGLFISIGLMSKYSFPIFLTALFFALFSIGGYRKIIVSRKVSILLFPLAVIALPHIIWLINNFVEISGQANQKLNLGETLNFHTSSIITFFTSIIGFITPLFLFLIFILFKKNNAKKNHSEEVRLFRNFYIFTFLVSILFTLFIEIPEVKVRWLHPIMMLFPVWFFLEKNNSSLYSEKFTKFFYSFVLALSILVIVIRILQNTVAPELGFAGRLNTPIVKTLEKIPEKYLHSSRLIVKDYSIAAHSLGLFKNNEIFFGRLLNKNFDNNSKYCLFIDIKPTENIKRSLSKGSVSTKYGDKVYEIFYVYADRKEC